MKYKWIILGIAVLLSGGLLLKNDSNISIPVKTNPEPVTKTYEYGDNTLVLGEQAHFPGTLVITPMEVTEDSRCPAGVQCIWAGTVKVKVNVARASGNVTEDIELGKPLTTPTERVELLSVAPAKKASSEINQGDYKLTFKVTEIPLASNPSKGGCYVGGCSGQICSDEPGAVSTCEYTAAYACYKTAKCERQSTGKCGWTPTAELNMCLSSAK